MRVLLYEFLTGGGLLAWPGVPSEDFGSLYREGAAMVQALAADLAALPQTEVLVLRDQRCAGLPFPGCQVYEIRQAHEDRTVLQRLAPDFDWTMLIAPECDGQLRGLGRAVRDAGGRLLGPTDDFLRVTSDKHATAETLRSAGIPAPQGQVLPAGAAVPNDFPLPAVRKPRFGAGSMDTHLLQARHPPQPGMDLAQESRLEMYCPGQPASVACFCGPAGIHACPPCWQRISADGLFQYLGGETPLPSNLAKRASDLAQRAVQSIPGALGYVGVDLVLGEDPQGGQDFVIEINPRLTTSYVGLRAAARTNLANSLVRVAAGEQPSWEFHSERIRFTSDGQVTVG